jgi:lysophospholipase L1-like esterase
MKNFKISIIGNSVGLRIRPPGKYPYNKNYGVILEELLQDKYPNKVVLVRNLCVGRATIWDILQKRTEILNEFPSYYIVNFGVSDASTREIPLWYSNIINSNKETWVKKICLIFYEFVLKKFRPFLVRLRGKKTWTSKKKFEKYFYYLLDFLEKGTNSKLIVISINNASERIEEQIPGSAKKYTEYNDIIKKVTKKFNAQYIDTTDLMSEVHTPDGIHFSLEGHQVIAERVYGAIVSEEN